MDLHQLVEPLDFDAARLRLRGPPAHPLSQLAGGDRSHQEGHQRHPVLRVLNCQRAHRREKEIVEAQHRHHRRHRRLAQPPPRRDPEDRQQQGQRHRGVVDRNKQAKERDRSRDQEHSGGVSQRSHVRPNRRLKNSRVRRRISRSVASSRCLLQVLAASSAAPGWSASRVAPARSAGCPRHGRSTPAGRGRSRGRTRRPPARNSASSRSRWPIFSITSMRSGVFSTLIENAGALQPQVHQGEIDVVVAAHAGLQRIARPLLPLQARAHLRQFLARPQLCP